jgi:perosamine synthetase
MRHRDSLIPVVPTLSVSDLFKRGGPKWESAFPFSSPRGAWALTGRVALYLGLPVLELPPRSTVLVPSYFHGVEIDTLLAAGHALRFYRVTDDFSVDLDHVETLVDGDVSALFVIHYFGFPQRLTSIRDFCDRKGLKLIEDCALSLFSRDENGPLGSVGDLSLYSPYKTLALPHGGYVVTRGVRPYRLLSSFARTATAVQVKDLIHLGMKARGWNETEKWILRGSSLVRRAVGWNRDEMVGSGYASWDPRMLEFGASPWLRRFMKLVDPDHVVARRRENYLRLAARLRGRAHTPPPFAALPDGVCPLFFPVMVDDKPRVHEEMARLGVQTINLWYDSHPACPSDLAAEASRWRHHLLELPIHQGLSGEDIDRVADALVSVLHAP